MSENLSETLFKPRLNIKETSTIVNPLASQGKPDGAIDDNQWYRFLDRSHWSWLGLDSVENVALLSRIAACDKPRTSELIDTVIGYQPGSWSYEWCQRAVAFQTEAKQALEDGDSETASQNFLLACYSATYAGYPHLKGDPLLNTSHAIAYSNFEQGLEHSKYEYRVLDIPVDGRKLRCYLHLPDTEQVYPLVIVSGGLDNIQTIHYPLFERYLAEAGIAMLTVDLPGIGHSSAWTLQQNSSELHLKVLEYLSEVPWVDEDRVVSFGYRFGGNIAARIGFLAGHKVKGVVTLGSPVDRMFSNFDTFKRLPQVYCDAIASRIGKTNRDRESLFGHVQSLSLKTQGLIPHNRAKVPYFVHANTNDLICPEEDVTLLKLASGDVTLNIDQDVQASTRYHNILLKVTKWLQKKL